MPIADSAATARRWATEREITLWVLFAGDLDVQSLREMEPAFDAIRAEGGRFALVVQKGAEPSFAGHVVVGPPAPSPHGIFAALQAAGVDDIRRVGVIGGSPSVLRAGCCAGAGATIGIAAADPSARLPLLDAQPDAIVTPAGFGVFDSGRFGRDRAHRQRVLLNPGPSVVSDRVHRAVGGPDLCHREPEYSDILEGLRRKLLHIAGVDDSWAMAMLAGSGTSAMEAMTLASTRPGRKLLVCRNGIYGERIETIARRAGIEFVIVSASDLTPIDPAAVAAALDADDTIDALAVIHHETTTGLLNPVHEIAAEAQRRGVRVLVDAISSFGAEVLRLAGTGIDFVASTSNKCLHGLPGAAFILISPLGQERIDAVPPRSLYFDLAGYLRAQTKRTVPFTPAIPAVYGLDAALDELLDEGPLHRQEYYQARMDFLDREFVRLGLEPRVAREHRSRCVRSLPLPEGTDYDALHDALKAEGYIIYGGLGEAAKTSFRVCALGALKIEALEGFIAALELAVAAQRCTVVA